MPNKAVSGTMAGLERESRSSCNNGRGNGRGVARGRMSCNRKEAAGGGEGGVLFRTGRKPGLVLHMPQAVVVGKFMVQNRNMHLFRIP